MWGGVRRDDDFHRLEDVHDPRHAGRQARIGPVETGECGALIPVTFSRKFAPPKNVSRGGFARQEQFRVPGWHRGSLIPLRFPKLVRFDKMGAVRALYG
jgi:hypothetical protein